MPGPKPIPIDVTDPQRQALQKLVDCSTTQQRLVTRAHIILMSAQGYGTRQIARALRLSEDTVCHWRERWREYEAHSLCANDIEKRLADAPRPGGPPTFTAEAWCQIMALACEDPKQSGRPISHWTIREVAEEAILRQIVQNISPSHLGRFFKRSRSQAPSDPLLAQPTS